MIFIPNIFQSKAVEEIEKAILENEKGYHIIVYLIEDFCS